MIIFKNTVNIQKVQKCLDAFEKADIETILDVGVGSLSSYDCDREEEEESILEILNDPVAIKILLKCGTKGVIKYYDDSTDEITTHSFRNGKYNKVSVKDNDY